MRQIWKNGWILLVAVMLPVILYTAYQLSTLSEDEENLNLIYKNQLDAILFSANQSSDNIISGWITNIEKSMEDLATADSLINFSLFQFQPSVFQIYISENGKEIMLDAPDADTTFSVDFYRSKLPSRDSEKVLQLKNYASNGYQKIETEQFMADGTDYLLLYFILLNNDNQPSNRIGAIVIDPEIFIRETLSSKFQQIAQDKFVLSAFEINVDTPIYSTNDTLNTESIAATDNFWLLPNYYLTIGTPGKPVQEIVWERTMTNLGILLTLILFLAVAAFLILRNVKREINLAQKKADFVSNVSHELRTPLALISMFAETLEMGRVPSEDKKKEYYQIMQKESSRLTGIVNKILTFSQMESGRKKFRKDKLDLNDIVSEVLSNYEFHLKSKGFGFTLTLSDDPCPFIGDKEGIEEVFINLLDNAIKYSKERKQIDIKTLRTDHKVVLNVRDQGIGIPKHDQAQIFEKFFRVSVGDLAQAKGTGLGLSLVKEIIEEHNGEIRVESEPGQGSIFMIILPLAKNKEHV